MANGPQNSPEAILKNVDRVQPCGRDSKRAFILLYYGPVNLTQDRILIER
jgi:hypothetical protein